MCAQAVMQHSVPSHTLADVLERVLDKGLVIAGDIKIRLVDIELLTIQLRLVICSVEKAREIGLDWWARPVEQEAPQLQQPKVQAAQQGPGRCMPASAGRQAPPVQGSNIYTQAFKRAARSASSATAEKSRS